MLHVALKFSLKLNILFVPKVIAVDQRYLVLNVSQAFKIKLILDYKNSYCHRETLELCWIYLTYLFLCVVLINPTQFFSLL